MKSWELDRGLVILRAGQSDLLRQLEQTIPSGRPVLIEEVGEELDPSLDPLLSRSIQKQGGVEMIQIGDGMVSTFTFCRSIKTNKKYTIIYLGRISP